jgi:hypothetical protein
MLTARLNEDQRAAVGAAIGIATQLIGVALAFIAAEAVLMTFVLDKRIPRSSFNVMVFATFLLLILSIIVGAVYANGLRIALFYGDVNANTDRNLMRIQTILGLLGVLMFAMSAWASGAPKDEASIKLLSDRITVLENKMTAVQAALGTAGAHNGTANDETVDVNESLKNLCAMEQASLVPVASSAQCR